jgi:hypothetical protein
VSLASGTMTFTSTGGKTFTVASDGTTPPALSEVKKDDGTSVSISVTLNASGGGDTAPVLVENVQVYNPDGSEYTGSDVMIKGWMYPDGDNPTKITIGRIRGEKLTLIFPDAKNIVLYSDLEFFSAADKLIGLSLLRTDKIEGFDMCYFRESYKDNESYDKGWNFLVFQLIDKENGNLADNPREVRPLRWFYDNGFKWVYNQKPLWGTWERPASQLIFSGNDYTYTTSSGQNYTYDGTSNTGTFTESGGQITFTWGVTGTYSFSIAGNCLDGGDTGSFWGRWKRAP